MVILGVLGGQNLHPVNYGFLSAAFFAFHLLLAYLVDHISIHAGVLRLVARQRVPRRVVPADRRRHALRHRARGPGAVRVPRALQLRVLLRGLHGPDGHHRRHPHAVRPDAGDRACGLGRCIRAARPSGRRDARRHHHGRERPLGGGPRPVRASPATSRARGASARSSRRRRRSASTSSRSTRSPRTTGSGRAAEVAGTDGAVRPLPDRRGPTAADVRACGSR